MNCTRLVVTGLLAAAAAAEGASVDPVGWRENGGIDVPPETTLSVEGTLSIGAGGTFIKGGGGTLVVPAAATAASHGKLVVGEGTLRLTSDPTAPDAIAAPDCVAAKAALWLDASKDGSVVLDGGAVARWLDVRDVGAPVPARRCAVSCDAEAKTENGEAYAGVHVDQTLEQVSDGEVVRRAVYFGGYVKNGVSFMKFCDASGADAAILPAYSVFVVHGVKNVYGSIFGYRAQPSLPVDTTYPNVNLPGVKRHFHNSTPAATHAFGGRYYLDGERIDAFNVPPKTGFQLLACDFCETGIPWDSLFACRRADNRFGGDYICEIIAFDRRLAESERVEVEAYLMRKWRLGRAAPNVRIGLSRRGAVEISVGGGTAEALSDYCLRLDGEGALVKNGAGELALDSGPLADFNGAVKVEDGAVLTRGGIPPPIMAEPGRAYAVGRRADPTKSGYAKSGVVVSSGAGEANAVTKTGEGSLTFASLPEGLSKLNVAAGELTLAGTAEDGLYVEASVVKAEIPNADFEASCADIAGAFDQLGRAYWQPGQERNGWTIPSSCPIGRSGFSNCSAENFWSAPHLGGQTLFVMLSDHGSDLSAIYTTVRFPAAGEYLVSWSESAYTVESSPMAVPYSLRVGPEWRQAEAVVRRSALLGYFSRIHAKVVVATAGDYALGFRVEDVRPQGASGHAMVVIDNVRADYVPTKRPAAVKIPNGDFEDTYCVNKAPGEFLLKLAPGSAPSPDNKATGWTLAGGAVEGSSMPAVAIVSPSSPSVPKKNHQTQKTRYADLASVDHGSVQLLMATKAGVDSGAYAETTFSLSAGVYRLQGRLANRNVKYYDWKNGDQCPRIKAMVTINGRQTRLGTVTVVNHDFAPHAWETPFTMAETGEVTLRLEADPVENAVALVDDLELIAEDSFGAASVRELVAEGSFEKYAGAAISSPWESVAGADGRVCEAYTAGQDSFDQQFGWAPYDGRVHVCIRGQASLEQDVGGLSSGRYRFQMAVHSRNSGAAYGNNPYRVFLRNKATGEEVAIGEGRVSSFLPECRRYEFDVREAASYRLVIQGLGNAYDPDPNQTGNRCSVVDAVSLKRVPLLRKAAPTGGAKLEVSVASGAKLNLDFEGRMTVKSLRVGGRRRYGEVNAVNCSAISGTGSLMVLDRLPGLVIGIR